MSESNIGRWDRYYRGWSKDKTHFFGCDTTYRMGYEFLKDCAVIEDWGCGYGGFSVFCKPGQYRGLDCSCTPHAAEQVDFVTYRSSVPGIFMRHVLEHNPAWRTILRNALKSFTERMVLVLFTPLVESTSQIHWDTECGNPTYSFSLKDIMDELAGFTVKTDIGVKTRTMHKQEHIFYIE